MSTAVTLDIDEVVSRFPGFRVALVVVTGLTVFPEGSPALAAEMAETEQTASQLLAGVELADIPEIKYWREAYKAFGVKKTSYRSSVERLLKAIQRGNRLPRVNALVDAYNAISVSYRMPIGADDLDRVAPPLAFRYSRPGDSFIALGDADRKPDPPKPGEVVYADAGKCLCRRWNWYQDDRSAIGPETTRAILTVQTLTAPAAEVAAAAAELARLLAENCDGLCAFGIAEADRTRIEVPSP